MPADLPRWTAPALLLGGALALLLPFLLVTVPPSADLAQQVAQVRLHVDFQPDGPYRIQWATPHALSHALLVGCWQAVGPWHAGRLALALIALAGFGASLVLVRAFGRPWPLALLAAPLLFNVNAYWGFLSFAVGWPVFALYAAVLEGKGRVAPRAVACTLLAGLLYASHGLWFLAGGIWLLARGLFGRWKLAHIVLWGLCFVPWLAPAFWWRSQAQAAGFDSPAEWKTLWERMLPTSMADHAFGGLAGWTELVVFLGLLGFALFALVRGRERWAEGDKRLALAAGLLGVAYLALPNSASNTVVFHGRWLPYGCILGLLAVPLPRLRKRAEVWGPALFLLVFSLLTADTWVGFMEEELTGLEEAVAALPAEPAVLGLDLTPYSARIKRRPFIQSFAWAQVHKGGTLSFSFAAHASSVVVFKEPFDPPWTPHLEWFPQRLQLSDLDHFSHVLVHADPALGDPITGSVLGTRLRPLTEPACFRLYEVLSPPDDG